MNIAQVTVDPDARTPVVYALAGAGRIKIGKTITLRDRLKSYLLHCPFALDLLGTIPGDGSKERELHAECRKWRVQGEWFRDCAGVRRILAGHGFDTYVDPKRIAPAEAPTKSFAPVLAPRFDHRPVSKVFAERLRVQCTGLALSLGIDELALFERCMAPA